MSRHTHKSSQANKAKLTVEALEDRCLPAISLQGGLLSVVGTPQTDRAIIGLVPGDPTQLRVTLNGQTRQFDVAGVNSIKVDVRSGNDLVEMDQSDGQIVIPTMILGGKGDDILIGGGAVDQIEGQEGNDILRGQAENDILMGGLGNDDIDGGNGVDQITGGPGEDTFHVNDDAGGEILDKGVDTDSVKLRLDQAPQAVQDAVNNLLGGLPLDSFKKEYQGADTFFNVEYTLNGQEQSALLAPNGDIVEQVQQVNPVSLPEAVTGALKRRHPKGKIQQAEFRTAGSASQFEIELKVGKRLREVLLATNGTILEDNIEAPEAPAGQLEARSVSIDALNPFSNLKPGLTLTLEGVDDGEQVQLIITVLDAIKIIDGVEVRVVEEKEFKNGQLFEVSKNYFTVDEKTGDLYYYGEDVDFYENGQIVGHGGTWRSGQNGDRFGVLVPGQPRIGLVFQQENAPPVALDVGEIVSTTEVVDTLVGQFTGVLKVRETTPLEPAALDFKWFAPGLGLIQSNTLQLVSFSGL